MKMESFLIGIFLGGILVGFAVFIFGVIGGVYLLAKHDLFWTFVEEATAKAIMKFNASPKIIMQYENCELDNNGDVVLRDSKKPKRKSLFGGLKWVGIPGIYSVYAYRFTWATVKPQEKEEKQIERRGETIKHIFVKDYVYLAEIKGAETASLVPLDVSFLVTTRVINPYKALFRVHDWVNVIVSRIEAYFRQFVSGIEYEDLIAQSQQMGGQIMAALGKTGMLEFDEELPDGTTKHRLGKFLEDYGIKVKNIEMRDIDPVGENKKIIMEAATRKWVADRDLLQISILADAESQRIDKVYTKIKEHGEEGLAIRMLESIDKAGEKPGNWIVPFGSAQQLIQSMFKPKNGGDK
jgi:hypothetical protein